MSEFSEKVAEMLGKAHGHEMVTITKKEYDRLVQSEEFLECLEACGVDNWGGYDDACEMYRDDEWEDE